MKKLGTIRTDSLEHISGEVPDMFSVSPLFCIYSQNEYRHQSHTDGVTEIWTVLVGLPLLATDGAAHPEGQCLLRL